MLEAFERRGGAEARNAAERHWTAPDADTLAAYIEQCVPLYTVRGDVLGGPPGPRTDESGGHAALRCRVSDAGLPASAAAIQCPTLVLVGEDDAVTPAVSAELIVSLIPADLARLERFADCGHGTHRDQPERTETAIRTFLESWMT